MTLPDLKLIPAGAGSGKTYTLEKTLGRWVSTRAVAPERIIAVTFTEAAAAELASRLRQELVRAGTFEAALRLDQAYISTIHGFGLRLLKEFAFDAGLSPTPRLLSDGEEDAFVRMAVARTDKADTILADLEGFGYRWDPVTQKGGEDEVRGAILAATKLLRDLDRTSADDGLVTEACAWVREVYGVTDDGASLTTTLHRAVTELLRAFPHCLADLADKKAGKDEFRKNHRALLRAADHSILSRDWALWQSLRSLRLKKRGTPTPAGYDDLARAVMEAADALPTHPGPRDHALAHLRCLLESGQDVLVRHAQAKAEAGLIDFSDMLSLSYRLLASRPDVLATLRQRIDCMVIDEFQDTNPLQFSLLWLLKAAGIPTIIVGDLKQAIMGFQGADPRLFQALQEQNAELCQPLDANWRSQPDLMDIINRIGRGLFSDYVDLAPKGTAAELDPLEVLDFHQKPKRGGEIKAKELQPAHVAVYVRDLLADPTAQVVDRRTKLARPLRGSDIAILCPTHDHLAAHAKALRQVGVKVRLDEDGWLSSRVVQLALHALDFVADPEDRHAALFLAVTEFGSHSLADGLKTLCDGERLDDPLLQTLERLHTGPRDRTVASLVTEVVDALDLLTHVETWPDEGQSRADLVRLLAEAAAFDETEEAALAGAALHGRDVRVFRAWLQTRAEQDNRRPAARVRDDDAVQLATWHASKGREWPVTVVGGLERAVAPRLPDLAATYEDFADLSNILRTAHVRWSPSFAAPESSERFASLLTEAAEESARRLLYVALTRARDRLVLCWPSYLVGSDEMTHLSVLAEKAAMAVTDTGIRIGEADITCRRIAIGAVDPRSSEEASFGSAGPLQRTYGRRAVVTALPPADLTPDAITASGHHDKAGSAPKTLSVEFYAPPLRLETRLPPDVRGTLVHRCFEVLPLLDDPKRLAQALQRSLSPADFDAVAERVRAFEDWLLTHYPGAILHREVPVVASSTDGSIITGTIDLVVETDEGLTIIDHKTEVVDDLQAAVAYHWPQLAMYAEALATVRPDFQLVGMGIHWAVMGKIATAVR